MKKSKYPPEIRHSNGNIKVLYEKCYNIHSLLSDVSDKLDGHITSEIKTHVNMMEKMGALEERTVTTKNLVYGTLTIALAAIATTVAMFFG